MSRKGQDDQTQRTEWMSTREAAEYIGVTETTVYRLVDEGLLAAYRPARSFRFRRSDLDAYLEAVRVRPGEVAHLRGDSAGRVAKAARSPRHDSDDS